MPPIEDENKANSDSLSTSPKAPDSYATTVAKDTSRKKKIFGAGILALLLAGLGLFVVKYYLDSKQPSETTTFLHSQTALNGSVFCVDLGISSLQCEDLDTKETRKYIVPESLGQITRTVSNPSGDKFYISAWIKDSDFEQHAVYGNDLKLLHKLPAKYDDDNTTGDLIDIGWLDNNTIMYVRTVGTKEPRSRIYSFDASNGKETELMAVNSTIERYIPSGNKRYIFGIRGQEDKEQNAIVRDLVLIDLEKKEVKAVENNVLDVDLDEPGYNQQSSQFYANILDSEQQKSDIKVFKVESLDANPKLVEVQQIKNANYYVPYFGQVTVTKKGILAQPDLELGLRAPIRFYTSTGAFSEEQLAVGSRGSMTLSLPSFPNFPAAATNDVVVSDFFQPPKGAPQKIIDFLSKNVTGNPSCKKGEYSIYELDKYDGESQFSVLESSCEFDGLTVYKLEKATYKVALRTQEGIGCDERDKAGISEKVIPSCLKPGEEL
jgi:hypothetical protein